MLVPMSIRAVIFDRDNTIVYFDPFATAALEARISAIAPSLPSAAAAAYWRAWPGPWPRSGTEEPEFWRTFWSSLAERYALPATVAAALHEIGAFYHTCFVAFSDVAPCLQALRAQDLRLAVLTNFELPSIHLTLQHAGLDPKWFAALLSSSALGVFKPDPRAYLAAAAALELAPGECLFVDDLPVNVEAACAAGMRGVLLDRRREFEHVPFERVDNLDSLVALCS
jgi:FMN phosphatase YigB (HAD superfamily)